MTHTEVKANVLTQFKPSGEKAFSRKPTSVLLPVEMHEYVHSLPNRAEWLRQAIAAQIERDRMKQHST